MRAAVISKGALAVESRPSPAPGAGDVVVDVHAAGLNAADLLQRQGRYPSPPGWPVDIPGMEMAGVVSSVGDGVATSLLGRRVCGLVGGGAHAAQCAIPAEHLIMVPDRADWLEAGAFPEAFATAHDALVTQGRLQPGERVLVSGAAGGVGTAAIQIAHALGAHVTAVTRTGEHRDELSALGADETIATEQVADLEPVDVLLELVGAAHLGPAQRVLADFARVVVIGLGGGSRVEVDLQQVMVRRATITGSTLRSRSRREKAEVIARVNDALVPRWSRGEVRVPLARVFELSEVAEAYDYFARPGKLGKVVLRVD